MDSPLQEFLNQALRDYQKGLENAPIRQRRSATINHRMRGAEEFARFLLGKPPHKTERIVGTLRK